MFLALWYYLRGYVMIKAKGFSAERFMNMATFRGVYLWDIAQDGVGMTMKAAGGSLPLLEACAEKTGCGLEILGWGGLPAFLRRFRSRQAWTAGLLLFALGLYGLSSFVWVVEVEGNERLSTEEILSACKEMGLCPGAWKGHVDTQAVTNGLLEGFGDISWVSVSIKGTDVTVKLAETIEKAEMVDKETPCHIIANADGVVLQITAERGTPMVAAGDVVKKGDILISSEILIGLEGEQQHREYVAAEGAVTARIWQRLAEEMPLQYEEKVYGGKEKENNSLIVAEKELDLIHPNSGEEWERSPIFEKPLALGDFTLPLKWKKELWKSYEMVAKSRTAEEAKALLEENLRKKAENLLSTYGTIEEMTVRYAEYADSVRGEAEIVMAERIGEKRQLQKESIENDTTEKEREVANGTI
ncbi:MAG: sporulation protein YqfD [Anaerotignum sp.]|nr:sporulation protein YqfD [Anaerotignum sp.]